MMKKLFRSRYLLGGLCLVLAFAVAFVLLPRLNRDRAATVTAVKARQDIAPGTRITESMLTAAETGAFGLPDTVLRSAEEAVGKVASDAICAGEFVTSGHLTEAEDYRSAEAFRSKGLGSGRCLVAVAFPTASAGIAGELRGGCTADVYEYSRTVTDEGETVYSAAKVLNGMHVWDVRNRSLESLSELDARLAEIAEDTDSGFDFVPAYVIFRCTASEAGTLIRLDRAGTLHLTLTKEAD